MILKLANPDASKTNLLKVPVTGSGCPCPTDSLNCRYTVGGATSLANLKTLIYKDVNGNNVTLNLVPSSGSAALMEKAIADSLVLNGYNVVDSPSILVRITPGTATWELSLYGEAVVVSVTINAGNVVTAPTVACQTALFSEFELVTDGGLLRQFYVNGVALGSAFDVEKGVDSAATVQTALQTRLNTAFGAGHTTALVTEDDTNYTIKIFGFGSDVNIRMTSGVYTANPERFEVRNASQGYVVDNTWLMS